MRKMISLSTILVLCATWVTVSQAIWPPDCISVEREIDDAFYTCYFAEHHFPEQCASLEITDRMAYCYPWKAWMAAVWYPHDLPLRHACYDCTEIPGSSCSCYSGVWNGYFYNVASSWCSELSAIPDITTNSQHACRIRNDIRRYYEGIGQAPLCSHGAVRFGLPWDVGVWVSGTNDRCFNVTNALDDGVTMWAFR